MTTKRDGHLLLGERQGNQNKLRHHNYVAEVDKQEEESSTCKE